MSRTPTDAERSLARYLSESLSGWEIWTLRTYANESRPYAVVKPMMSPDIQHQSVRIIDVTMPFIVYCYPAIGDTDVDGHTNVYTLQEQLYDAFFVQNAKRVPMYDYSTSWTGEGYDLNHMGGPVPWGTPGPPTQDYSARDAAGNAIPDYFRVEEYQMNQAQDADDARRWSATLTLRLAWRRYGQLVSGSLATGLTIAPIAPSQIGSTNETAFDATFTES